jgi:hypothetical protein
MPKFRKHKVKREHHVLAALEPGLALLGSSSLVNAVIPGPIRPKGGGSIGWTIQYATTTGLKLLGRSPGAVQEVFVVAPDPQALAAWLRAVGLVPSQDGGPSP